ncbi:MAG: tRNA-dihydrouridine synthase family protein [Lachnospiraceae bacterium]|nr:tRNA-dihydrouridine synthase family protein [Lachnospiraceae bacterium]
MNETAFYYAPMEGITNHCYRRLHHKHFPGIDKYFMPFMAPHLKGHIKNKEKNDIFPGNNEALTAVPQILTNDAESFIITARMLKDLGYPEVNLNLGCPSPTVVTKGKGSGFLAYPEKLDVFLETIFNALEGEIAISVKTRLGMTDPAEAEVIFPLYEKYPLEELIIHPRTQKDFYKNTPNREMFKTLAEKSRHKICYNGNLYTEEDCRTLLEEVPVCQNLMLGRGLLRNPALVRKMKGGRDLNMADFRAFHDEVYEAYRELYDGPSAILGHMKELWVYMESMLTAEPRDVKAVRKARKLPEYELAVRHIFNGSEIVSVGDQPRETEAVKL